MNRIWDELFGLWEARNQLIHNSESDHRDLIDAMKNAEELKEASALLTATDREFLDMGWEQRATWRTANWKRWTANAKAITQQAKQEGDNGVRSMDIRNWMRGKGK